jgi:hypothetical protein
MTRKIRENNVGRRSFALEWSASEPLRFQAPKELLMDDPLIFAITLTDSAGVDLPSADKRTAEPNALYMTAQIGEVLTLTVRSNAAIISVMWEVAGLVVSTAVQGPGAGGYVPFFGRYINPTQLAMLVPGYYTVTCTGLTSRGPAVSTHMITVSGPRVINFSATPIGRPMVRQSAGGQTMLQLWQSVGGGGISFSALVDAQGCVGSLGFMQLANDQRFRVDTDNHGHDFSINDQWVLDNGANPTSIIYRNQTWPTAVGQVLMTSSDAPGGELAAPVKTYSIGVEPLEFPERFRLFVMFKPTVANGFWVPLQELVWSWGGAATLNDNGVGYRLSDLGSVFSYPATSMQLMAQMPFWSSNTQAGVWL